MATHSSILNTRDRGAWWAAVSGVAELDMTETTLAAAAAATQSCLTAIPWTAAPQAPLSMGFSRQKYWSGVPLPSVRFI